MSSPASVARLQPTGRRVWRGHLIGPSAHRPAADPARCGGTERCRAGPRRRRRCRPAATRRTAAVCRGPRRGASRCARRDWPVLATTVDARARGDRGLVRASMSGVTAASVSGMPRSRARLSASASSRRIRPAIASLVSGGSASAPSSSSEACRCSSRSRPALAGGRGRRRRGSPAPASTRARGGHRGPRRAAQVGVVEVGQPVGGGPHLAAHPPLLPGQHAVVRADPGEQRGDRVAVPDHHPVDARGPRGPWRRCRSGGRRRPAPAPPPGPGR